MSGKAKRSAEAERSRAGANGSTLAKSTSAAPPANGQLSPEHHAQLQASGITPEIAAARGWRTVTDAAELATLGFADYQCLVPALLGPIHSPKGEVVLHQIRPNSPRIDPKKRNGETKYVKYETPSGKKLRLDVPPPVREHVQNRKKPLVITEGMKKGDALASIGVVCVVLTGVWAWCRKNKQTGSYIPRKDWKHVPLNRRRVYICFDSDAKSNPKVHHAERELAKYLRSRGARVKIIRLPAGPNGAKVGADDYIAAGHTSWGDFLALVEGDTLDADFWKARKVLRTISRAAYARTTSREALLLATLTRVAATVPHTIRLPAIVGSWQTLSLLGAIKGEPGVGKTNAASAAEDLYPLAATVRRVDLSSGEGLAEALMEDVYEGKNPVTGKPFKVRRQVWFNAFSYIDEGSVVSELGGRNGSTITSTLRKIFSGQRIGQSNATKDRTRQIGRGAYNYGILLALQPTAAAPLFAEQGLGTPQRFLWASATDPDIPDEPPPWPERGITWTPPASDEIRYLEVATAIATEVRSAVLASARGERAVASLDEHRNLIRLKVAGIFALLDNRLIILETDWALAGRILDNSDRVRGEVLEELEHLRAQEDERRGKSEGRRAGIAEEVRESLLTDQTARRITSIVWSHNKPVTKKAVQNKLSKRQRDVMEAAISLATEQEWVVPDGAHLKRGRAGRHIR